MMFELTINNAKRKVDVDPRMPLLWVLRDHLELNGHKIRLWRRLVRRLHRAPERGAGALVPNTHRYDR
jgi:hypothetical protein